jgi:acetyltransferase-like isoleucine patch superfamily enzyme
MKSYAKAFISVLISSLARRVRVVSRRAQQTRLGIKGMVARQLDVEGSIEVRGLVAIGHDCSIVVSPGGRLIFDGNNHIMDRCLIAVPSGCLMHIGSHVCLQNDTQIHGSVSIGAMTVMAAYVYINSGSHSFRSSEFLALPIRIQDHAFPGSAADHPITIEQDCWIGARVTILRGATISRGSIVGACSLLTHSTVVRPFEVIAGVPARHLGWRWNISNLLPTAAD